MLLMARLISDEAQAAARRAPPAVAADRARNGPAAFPSPTEEARPLTLVEPCKD